MRRLSQFRRFLDNYETHLKKEISSAETAFSAYVGKGGCDAVEIIRAEFDRLFDAMLSASKK